MIDPDDRAMRRLRMRVKMDIRKRHRAIRKALPSEAREARSAALVARLETLDEVTSARVVAGFWPLAGEPLLPPLYRTLRAGGATLALPRTHVETGELSLHQADPNALEAGAFGVMEPPADAPVVPRDAVDIVLVPALAADARGHRIGYGKGFYDRFLPTLPNALRIIVAYDFELLAELPNEPQDVPGHLVVSDRQTWRVSDSG